MILSVDCKSTTLIERKSGEWSVTTKAYFFMNILKFFFQESYDKDRYQAVKHYAKVLNALHTPYFIRSHNCTGQRIRTQHNTLHKTYKFKYLKHPLIVKYGKDL